MNSIVIRVQDGCVEVDRTTIPPGVVIEVRDEDMAVSQKFSSVADDSELPPLPWQLGEFTDRTGFRIYTEIDGVRWDVGQFVGARKSTGGLPKSDPGAIARFIVNAVNAHHKLVAAGKAVLKHCALVHKHWGDNCNREEADAAQKALTTAVTEAEAALCGKDGDVTRNEATNLGSSPN